MAVQLTPGRLAVLRAIALGHVKRSRTYRDADGELMLWHSMPGPTPIGRCECGLRPGQSVATVARWLASHRLIFWNNSPGDILLPTAEGSRVARRLEATS